MLLLDRAVPLPDRVSAVVFDLDGLLVDSEAAWLRAEEQVFTSRGVGFGAQDRAALTGLTLDGIVSVLLVRLALPAGARDALAEELQDRVAAQGERTVRALPGARGLVLALAGHVPLGIASNSSRAALDDSLAAVGLTTYFSVTVSADDVIAPKPSPEPYLRAFAALEADPARGVTFEDSATGAEAARGSGAFLVTVPASGRREPRGDLTVGSLNDPVLRSWARRVTSLEAVGAREAIGRRV